MKYRHLLLISFFASCTHKNHYDVIIKGGLIYDGNGRKPYTGDVAIKADTIAMDNLSDATAQKIIDAKG